MVSPTLVEIVREGAFWPCPIILPSPPATVPRCFAAHDHVRQGGPANPPFRTPRRPVAATAPRARCRRASPVARRRGSATAGEGRRRHERPPGPARRAAQSLPLAAG